MTAYREKWTSSRSRWHPVFHPTSCKPCASPAAFLSSVPHSNAQDFDDDSAVSSTAGIQPGRCRPGDNTRAEKQEGNRPTRRLLADNIPVYTLPEHIFSSRLYGHAIPVPPPSPSQPRNYIIASSRRTGSTMLCTLLSKTGRAGRPKEYIQQKFNIAAE